ncbi:MmcQ/YjbR family DNA-binding protein [Paeniglutamicibacter sp. R2-26]|uniref:MmcQ/YjbR family DNA-binding protein n=1 Tax=Paeniglutamicibacter sp. R2-26 TaxID=3144417 RepID=UPI003EE677FD
MSTEDDVRRLCLALPGVTERQSWQRPAWFARTLMARIWEEGVLTVKTGEREALAAMEPETYYWTPHHDHSPLLLLVRLERVDPEELRELLLESHRLAGGRP